MRELRMCPHARTCSARCMAAVSVVYSYRVTPLASQTAHRPRTSLTVIVSKRSLEIMVPSVALVSRCATPAGVHSRKQLATHYVR
jgi:hypothetical protein